MLEIFSEALVLQLSWGKTSNSGLFCLHISAVFSAYKCICRTTQCHATKSSKFEAQNGKDFMVSLPVELCTVCEQRTRRHGSWQINLQCFSHEGKFSSDVKSGFLGRERVLAAAEESKKCCGLPPVLLLYMHITFRD